jgi:HAD superfamily hydrolase (TIGR01509 family)
MAIRGLLFDFDGLIVDTEGAAVAAWQELYREHGQELPLDLWATLIGTIGAPFDPMAHLEQLVGRPLDGDVSGRLRDRELSLGDLEQLRPGVLDYLEGARGLGLKTAIVSSSSRPWVDRHLLRLERAEHWDAIVTADRDPRRAKPTPTLYLEALDALNLEPSEAIALEDSPNGVRAAKAAQIFTVAVPNATTAQLPFDEADLVLDSLADLPLPELLERLPGVEETGE